MFDIKANPTYAPKYLYIESLHSTQGLLSFQSQIIPTHSSNLKIQPNDHSTGDVQSICMFI